MTAKETAVELARILLLNEIEYLKFLKAQKEAAADDSRQEDPATAHKDTPAKSRSKGKYTAMTAKKRKPDALKQLSEQAQRRIETAKTDPEWTKHFLIWREIEILRRGGE